MASIWQLIKSITIVLLIIGATIFAMVVLPILLTIVAIAFAVIAIIWIVVLDHKYEKEHKGPH